MNRLAMHTTAILATGMLLAGLATRTMAGTEHAHALPPAVDDHAAHAHPQARAMVAGMQLDQGRKWVTDTPLRAGMAAIETAFDHDHAAIHAGTETAAQYDALAARIEQAVQDVVANCRLPPAADVNLHYAIADLTRGIALMRGEEAARSRHDGAALVHGALLAYAKYFDDPAAAE